MTFRVLVIPEDPTLNGYILKPLVERMMRELGKPNARVMVLTNPKVGGYDQAVRAIRDDLPVRYRHFDLWLFLPDADRANNTSVLEDALAAQGITLRVCAAQPEVEIWLLAGFRDDLEIEWRAARAHPRLKEVVFEPFLESRGDPFTPGGGREALMRATLGRYDALIAACPELRDLQERLRALPELNDD